MVLDKKKTQNTTPPREQNKAKKTVYKVCGKKKGVEEGWYNQRE